MDAIANAPRPALRRIAAVASFESVRGCATSQTSACVSSRIIAAPFNAWRPRAATRCHLRSRAGQPTARRPKPSPGVGRPVGGTRVFAPAHGVPQDTATGSAADPFAVHLARSRLRRPRRRERGRAPSLSKSARGVCQNAAKQTHY